MSAITQCVTRSSEQRWLAIADVHGHAEALAALLSWGDRELGSTSRCCLLGDIVDYGPDIPGTLELVLKEKERRGERLQVIAGNHDLYLLRALGWPGMEPDPARYTQWLRNAEGRSTVAAYGAGDLETFARAFPARHRALLEALPWFVDTGEYVFVHAGLMPGPMAPQLERLRAKVLPDDVRHSPDQLWHRELRHTADPAWGRIVVSGHLAELDAPVSLPHRIVVPGDVKQRGYLRAVALPERRFVSVDTRTLEVREEGGRDGPH